MGEEFRMINLPRPDHAGKIDYGREKAKAAGESDFESEREAQAMATRLPVFNAVQRWLDVDVEIKLKEALEKMMKAQKIPALIIRSVEMDKISALTDLGIVLDVPTGGGEIDLVMAFVSGDVLNVVRCSLS